RLDVAVIGAGPFGFSIAAHLPNASVRVYGRPMETWRTTMPKDMLLRSAWDETSLSAPGDRGSIVDWARREGIDRTGPIPLSTFLAYADWFRGRFVRDHDPSDVVNVARRPDGFAIRTAAGDEALARRVALAIGVTPFAYAPEPLAGLVGDGRVRSAIQLRGFE